MSVVISSKVVYLLQCDSVFNILILRSAFSDSFDTLLHSRSKNLVNRNCLRVKTSVRRVFVGELLYADDAGVLSFC